LAATSTSHLQHAMDGVSGSGVDVSKADPALLS
jgi:hypothetical protein